MKILITGCAGFIGFHLCKKLATEQRFAIMGIDNLNNYYDINLKKNRLKILRKNKNFSFLKIDISKKEQFLNKIKLYKFNVIVHLAAQAGVRKSFSDPNLYKINNIVAFDNVLEFAKLSKINHLVYASSSSVYGNSKKTPLSENHNTDDQISYYGSTKKNNEISASIFSKMYNIPCTGLRFFTVYGPYGRPDMAPHLFTDAIVKGRKINLFNKGNLVRDFTYIDDVVEAMDKIIKSNLKKQPLHEIYNIGNGNPKSVKKFVKIIEKYLNLKANFKVMGMQKGDVFHTHADISKVKKKFKYDPKTGLDKGLKQFVEWYMSYY